MSYDEDREYEIQQKHRHDPRSGIVEEEDEETLCADCDQADCECEDLEIDDLEDDGEEGFDDEEDDDSDEDDYQGGVLLSSELGDIFKAHREAAKLKKTKNAETAVKLLSEKKVPYVALSEVHLRVGDFDYWPSTGLFIHTKDKKRGRGIYNLLKKLNVGTIYAK